MSSRVPHIQVPLLSSSYYSTFITTNEPVLIHCQPEPALDWDSFPDCPCFWWAWRLWGIPVWCCLEHRSIWVGLTSFSWLEWGCALGRKTSRVKGHSCYPHQGGMLPPRLTPAGSHTDPQLPPLQLLDFSFFCLFFGSRSIHLVTLRGGEVSSTSPRGRI